MTKLKFTMYVEGWVCSECKKENLDIDMLHCQHCDKVQRESSEEYFDDEREFSLPAVWEICPTCQGTGSTYLGFSSSDQPVFTSEDFCREGPDFYEDYMRGRYDAQCPECKGNGKVKEVDENSIKDADSKRVLTLLREKQDSDAKYAAEVAAERRMGC